MSFIDFLQNPLSTDKRPAPRHVEIDLPVEIQQLLHGRVDILNSAQLEGHRGTNSVEAYYEQTVAHAAMNDIVADFAAELADDAAVNNEMADNARRVIADNAVSATEAVHLIPEDYRNNL